MADDVGKLIAEAERQGWRVDRHKSGKYLLFAPGGVGIVTVHQTPSDHRWLKNAVSKMRQYGFKWEGR